MMNIERRRCLSAALLAACAQQPQRPQPRPQPHRKPPAEATGIKAGTGTSPAPQYRSGQARSAPPAAASAGAHRTDPVQAHAGGSCGAARAAAGCGAGLPRTRPRNQGSAHRAARHRARLERAFHVGARWKPQASGCRPIPNRRRRARCIAALLVNQARLAEAKPHLEKWLAADRANVGQNFLQLSALLARYQDKAAVLN